MKSFLYKQFEETNPLLSKRQIVIGDLKYYVVKLKQYYDSIKSKLK